MNEYIDENKIKCIEDFPKLKSPFVRKQIGSNYVVVDEVNEGYEWVFENNNTIAVEKLHGTNVSVLIEDGNVMGVWNRKNRIPHFSSNRGYQHIIMGVFNSINAGYVDSLVDGLHFGELIGEKYHNNPYDINGHLWIPFEYLKNHCYYKSWGKYPKTFDAISEWFEKDLVSLYYCRKHGLTLMDKDKLEERGFVEGIVFYHPDGRMAKLRRDMFGWFKGKRH